MSHDLRKQHHIRIWVDSTQGLCPELVLASVSGDAVTGGQVRQITVHTRHYHVSQMCLRWPLVICDCRVKLIRITSFLCLLNLITLYLTLTVSCSLLPPPFYIPCFYCPILFISGSLTKQLFPAATFLIFGLPDKNSIISPQEQTSFKFNFHANSLLYQTLLPSTRPPGSVFMLSGTHQDALEFTLQMQSGPMCPWPAPKVFWVMGNLCLQYALHPVYTCI